MVQRIWILLLAPLVFIGCRGGECGGTLDLGSGGGGSTTEFGRSTDQSIGEVTSDSFWVNVVRKNSDVSPATNASYYVHRYDSTDPTDVSLDCTVPKEGATETDIICYVEAPELELLNEGIAFHYNVPAGMCEYHQLKPFYYFSAQPVLGPTEVTIDRDGVSCTLNGPTQLGLGVRPCDTDLATALGNSDVAFQLTIDDPVLCAGDYTRNGVEVRGGIGNCCIGRYQQTVIDGGETTVTWEDWGGSYGNCADGPATATDGQDAFDELPINIYEYAWDNGLNRLYDLRRTTINDALVPVSYYANYYGDPTSTALSGISSIDLDWVGDERYGQPSYEFLCLDQAEDVKARIRVYVRAWSKNSEFQTYLTTGSGDHLASGSETDFPNPSPLPPYDYDDSNHWEEISAWISGSVLTNGMTRLRFDGESAPQGTGRQDPPSSISAE